MNSRAVLIELIDGQIVSRDADEWVAEQAHKQNQKDDAMQNTIKLRSHGLQLRLMRFFDANPSEELTVRQIATKFDTTEGRVRNVLIELVKCGSIENVRVVRLAVMGRS